VKLRIDRLKIVAVTSERHYGADISFESGLNVLRADNSSGKSTLANAILYGLGLEGMLGPNWPRPLKYALYEKLTDDNGVEHAVQESYVLLEISNDRDECWTVRRQIHGELGTDLVQVWDGQAISAAQRARHRGDMFVRTAGSARREAGFHTQLAKFIGWDLPEVVATDGGRRLLYLQLLFPFLFVEQGRGWSGVRENVPRFFRIRDADLRAVQFLLALEAGDRLGQREAIEASITSVRERWSRIAVEFRGTLRGHGVTSQGIPDRPAATWPPEPAPMLLAHTGDQRVPAAEELTGLRARLRTLRERELPTAAAATPETQRELAALDQQHREVAAARLQLTRDLAADEADLNRIDDRLAVLDADRKRHQDAKRIVGLGGSPATQLEEGRCPTCDQHWPHDLLGGEIEAVMTFDDNIAVIEQEQRALRALRLGAAAAIDDTRTRLEALTAAGFELQSNIRAHREVLVQDSRAPSASAVRERLLVEDRIERLSDLEAEMALVIQSLEPLAAEYRSLLDERRRLESGGLSQADRAKVSALERSLVDQLRAYDFRSIGGVRLSRLSLLPEREGFDLTYEASASDTIRLIWSYLLGLLEVARSFDTNHPGLLILDEPGQQDVENASVRALMERASGAKLAGQQVIVTITRGVETFISDDVTAHIVDFPTGQRVLQPLGDTTPAGES